MANMYCRMTRDKNLILRPIEYHYHTMMMIRNEVGETNTFSIQKNFALISCVFVCGRLVVVVVVVVVGCVIFFFFYYVIVIACLVSTRKKGCY